jgi:hypothetical protein
VTVSRPQLPVLVKENIVISTYSIFIQIIITGNPFLFRIFTSNSVNAVCRVIFSFHLHYAAREISLRTSTALHHDQKFVMFCFEDTTLTTTTIPTGIFFYGMTESHTRIGLHHSDFSSLLY